MMARKDNLAMRESKDNIDHKKIVITWISFADEVFRNRMHKRRRCSKVFDSRAYFGQYFWP